MSSTFLNKVLHETVLIVLLILFSNIKNF